MFLLQCVQVLLSLCYYVLTVTLRQLDTRPRFPYAQAYASVCYVLLPLLPVAFTLFWQVAILHGTIHFIRTMQSLGKLMSSLGANKRRTSNMSKGAAAAMRRGSQWLHRSDEHLGDIELADLSQHQQHQQQQQADESSAMLIGGDTRRQSRSRYDEVDEAGAALNELSSIESLLVGMPLLDGGADALFAAGAAANEATAAAGRFATASGVGFGSGQRRAPRYAFHSTLAKWRSSLAFQWHVLKSVLWQSHAHGSTAADDTTHNAAFVYYSNFLIGLGIITVHILFENRDFFSCLFLFLIHLLLFRLEFLMHRQEGHLVVGESDRREGLVLRGGREVNARRHRKCSEQTASPQPSSTRTKTRATAKENHSKPLKSLGDHVDLVVRIVSVDLLVVHIVFFVRVVLVLVLVLVVLLGLIFVIVYIVNVIVLVCRLVGSWQQRQQEEDDENH